MLRILRDCAIYLAQEESAAAVASSLTSARTRLPHSWPTHPLAVSALADQSITPKEEKRCSPRSRASRPRLDSREPTVPISVFCGYGCPRLRSAFRARLSDCAMSLLNLQRPRSRSVFERRCLHNIIETKLCNSRLSPPDYTTPIMLTVSLSASSTVIPPNPLRRGGWRH